MLFKKLDKHLVAAGLIGVFFILGAKIIGALFYIEWKYLDFAGMVIGFYVVGVYSGVYVGIIVKTKDLLYRGLFQFVVQPIYILWFLNMGMEKIDSVIDMENVFSTLTFVILYIAFPMVILSVVLYEIIKAAITGQLFQKKGKETDRGKDDNKKS